MWQEAEAAKQQRDSAIAAADEASQLAAELSAQVQQQRDNLLQLQTRREVCSLPKIMVIGSALLVEGELQGTYLKLICRTWHRGQGSACRASHLSSLVTSYGAREGGGGNVPVPSAQH